MILLLFVILLILNVSLVFLYFFYKIYSASSNRRYWTKLGVKPEKQIGSLLQFLTEKTTFMDKDVELYERVKSKEKFVGITEIGSHLLYLTDPDLVKQLLIKDFDNFPNRREFKMSKSDPILSKMLVFLEGQEWKNMRNLLSPNFTTGKIKRMFDRIEECCETVVDHLKNLSSAAPNNEVPIRDVLSSFTLDVISSTFFGFEANAIRDRDSIFAQNGRKMQKPSLLRLLKIVMVIAFPRLSNFIRVSFFERESTDFFHQIVKNAIKYREETGTSRSDFLQLLIDYKNDKSVDEKDKKVFLDDALIACQSVLFLAGGFDTVETLLSFSLYFFALHPECKNRIAEEAKIVMDRHGGKLTYEAVNELDYTERFINETLRLYPPAPRMERRALNEYKIPDTDIILPKNSLVVFPTYAMQRDSDQYPNPNQFDPDRWLPEIKNQRNQYTYYPFGQGPRNCIGMRFAIVESKAILAHLALNFDFEPTKSLPIPLKTSLRTGTMKPKGEILLKITPKQK